MLVANAHAIEDEHICRKAALDCTGPDITSTLVCMTSALSRASADIINHDKADASHTASNDATPEAEAKTGMLPFHSSRCNEILICKSYGWQMGSFYCS